MKESQKCYSIRCRGITASNSFSAILAEVAAVKLTVIKVRFQLINVRFSCSILCASRVTNTCDTAGANVYSASTVGVQNNVGVCI